MIISGLRLALKMGHTCLLGLGSSAMAQVATSAGDSVLDCHLLTLLLLMLAPRLECAGKTETEGLLLHPFKRSPRKIMSVSMLPCGPVS